MRRIGRTEWAAWACAIGAALLLCAGADARAGIVGPGAGGGGSGASHGWVAVRSDGWTAPTIRHLPPRGRADGAAPDGTVNVAGSIALLPEVMAAWENRVYLLFRRSDGPLGDCWNVMTIAAERSAGEDRWVYPLSAGRLEELPSLVGEGELLGACGTGRGLFALARSPSMDAAAFLLGEAGWVEVDLPRDWFAKLNGRAPLKINESGVGEAAIRVVERRDGVSILLAGEGGSGVWRGAFVSMKPVGSPEPTVRGGSEEDDGRTDEDHPGGQAPAPERFGIEWTWAPMEWRCADGRALPRPDGPVVEAGGRLTFAAEEGAGNLGVWQQTRAGWDRLGGLSGVGVVNRWWWFVPLDSASRIAVLWTEPIPGASSMPGGGAGLPDRAMIAEISAETGLVMYRGPAAIDGPISARDFKVLAMLLLALMMSVLLFVVRPDRHGATPALPPGLEVAGGGRRTIAGLIDLAPALLLAARAMGVGAGEAAAIWRLPFAEHGVVVLGLAFAFAAVHCTLCEWLWGASIGKLVTGCRVVAARMERDPADGALVPTVGRLRLWQAAARNAMRWCIPPIGLEAVLAPDRRHRGDVVARTVVVVPSAPGEEPPEE